MKNILLKYLLLSRQSSAVVSQNGFTLVEMVVITVIIGVLSLTAVPTWQGFTTRQRIRTVNDQVFQALRAAQSDAKLKKETRAVVFHVDASNLTPREIRIYPKEKPNTTNASTIKPIKTINLDMDGQIKPGQLKMTVQANGVDIGEDITFLMNGNTTSLKRYEIRFDYLGAVVLPVIKSSSPATKTDGFSITTSTPQDGMKRCIIVETLLGGMRSAQGSDCP